MRTIICDIEANGFLDSVDTIHQISAIDADTGECWSFNRGTLKDGYALLADPDNILVLHHGIGYDLPVLRKVAGLDIPPERVRDTLVLSRLGNPARKGGHSLEAWGPRLGVPVEKVVHEDWTRWSPDMERRCNVDVEITRGVWERLKPMYVHIPDAVETEHRVAFAAQEMIENGFTLDVPRALDLLSEKMTQRDAMLEKFQTMFPPIWMPKQPQPKVFKVAPNKRSPFYGILDKGVKFTPIELVEFNPTARQHVADRLIRKYGWRPKEKTGTGLPKVSEEVLMALPYPEAREFAAYLTLDKQIGQLNAPVRPDGNGGGWLHHVGEDNRIHPNFMPTGANTHRSSCSRPNLQQVDSDADMRSCWIPAPGLTMVGVDASGVDFRGLGHYLEPYDKGHFIDVLLNDDIHEYNRQLIGLYTRDRTKTFSYAWLYGAGDAKLGIIRREDAKKAGKLDDLPRIANSHLGRELRTAMEQGWEGLETLVRLVQKRAKTGKMNGLDGRPLWVRSEHSALNLLLQASSAVIIKKAWSLIDLPPEVRLLIQVHDEWQFECPPDMADDVGRHVIECIKKAGELLNFRCPLDGAYKVGANWSETH